MGSGDTPNTHLMPQTETLEKKLVTAKGGANNCIIFISYSSTIPVGITFREEDV